MMNETRFPINYELSGVGWVDCGCGTLDPINVLNGRLEYPVNAPNEKGEYDAFILVYLHDYVYRAYGDVLVEYHANRK